MKHIIIIDDDPGIQQALKAILEYSGFKVDLAERGDYIFKLPPRELPDLIIIDYLLSGKSGNLIIQKIKAEPKLAQIPIIMLSAHPQADQFAKEAGVDLFISKPFDMPDLTTKINQLIKND